MVIIKYKKNPGNVHSVNSNGTLQKRCRKVLVKGPCNKLEIYVQNCTQQHFTLFVNPLTIFWPDLPFPPLSVFLGIREERMVGLKV